MLVQNLKTEWVGKVAGKNLRISGNLNKEGPGQLFPPKTSFKVAAASLSVQSDGTVVFELIAVKK
jgi:hypothetical protein